MALLELEYGRTRRINVRRVVKRFALITSIVVAALAVAWYAAWRVQRLERDRLTAYFKAMPQVASVYVDGYSEDVGGLDYRVTGVGVRLKEPPGGFIWFDTSTLRSLRDVGEIDIHSIGPLSFEQTCGGKGYNSIGIGPGGEFAALIPITIHSAEDVIANYDRLIAALKALPPTGVVTHADGDVYTYSILVDREAD